MLQFVTNFLNTIQVLNLKCQQLDVIPREQVTKNYAADIENEDLLKEYDDTLHILNTDRKVSNVRITN